MIPQDKTEAVTRALRGAFGVAECEGITRITRGQTPSLVYHIVVQGSPYLLKIITRAEDPSRHYACMRAAADAGVAPRVLYTNSEEKISITDFVEASPLSSGEARARLPGVLRTLHDLPPFARAPFNTTCTFLLQKGPALDGYLGMFRAANLLPNPDREEFFARYEELAAIYPYGDAEMVASHNDLFKPDNILFDGRRLWLVDWEAAFLNDRYADLAAAANLVVSNDVEEDAFLSAYFGAAPDEYQRARFHLMRQIAHLFYAMAFLSLGAAGRPVDWSGPVPAFHEYQRRLWAGEINLADNATKVLYGRVHWERLRSNVATQRYLDALRVIAQAASRFSSRPSSASSASAASRPDSSAP